MLNKTAIRRGLIDGLALTATTTAATMVASQFERGSPWAALNPICHAIDGDDVSYGDEFDQRDTLVGTAILAAAMGAWGVLHEIAFGSVKWPLSVVAGAATAAGAYVFDYELVKPRYSPGIEQKIGRRSILAIYGVLGLTLAAMASVHHKRD